MVDIFSPAKRSEIMSKIKSKDTKPEMIVRRLTHRLGYRYRLHDKNLPGSPDLVFPSKHKVIFVHGCFWHSHNCARGKVKPASCATDASGAFGLSKFKSPSKIK